MENSNWFELRFGYIKTDCSVGCYHRDGKWGELKVSSSEIISTHMATTCLHYGQKSFGGLKAFRGKNGKIRVFYVDESAGRMQPSGRGIKMAELPVEMFGGVACKVMRLSERFVPPHGGGIALYIRPLMIDLGAQVGAKPAPECMFVIFVTPVGPYFRGGFQPSKVHMLREHDRATPSGIGTIKVSGNYTASLVVGEITHSKGYVAILHLDPKEKKYLDEYGPANFFRIRGSSYITPQSHPILPSIMSKNSQQLAGDMGLTAERRPVPSGEIATLDGAAECGTAAVIAPISQIDDLDENRSSVIAKDGKPGPVCEELYHKLRAIQYGDEPDTYGQISVVGQYLLFRKDWSALRLYETECVDRQLLA